MAAPEQRKAFLGLNQQDAQVFADSKTGDVLFFAQRSNQSLLFGTKIGAPSELRVSSVSGVSVNRRLGVGTSEPAVSLDVFGTDALALPAGCNLERPSDARLGMIRYNTDIQSFEGLGAGCNWTSLGGVIDVDRDTFIQASNDNTLKFVAADREKMRIDSNVVSVFGYLTLKSTACNVSLYESASSSFWSKTVNNDLYYSQRIGIGTSAPRVALDVRSTGAIALPAGTSNQRPADPAPGYLRYNTQAHALESFHSNAWVSVSGSGGGLQEDPRIGDTSNYAFSNLTSRLDQLSNSVSSRAYTRGCNSQDFEANNLRIAGNVLPISNEASDLGSSNYRFRDLYLSGSTLYLGSKTLSVDSNTDEIVVNGALKSTVGFKVGETSVVDASGSLAGSGSNLTDLNAGALTWGTVNVELLPLASTSAAGIVRLEGGIGSFCNDRAATADAVRLAYSNAESRLALSGGTVAGSLAVNSNLDVAGDLAVVGNLVVSGTTTTVDTETLLIKDNLVVLNSSNMPLSGVLSGIEISRGADSNYQFVFVEDTESFKIGTADSLQAVATRPDSIADRSVPFWDILENWLAFDSNVKVSSAGTLSATLFDGSGSNLTDLNAGRDEK